MLQLLRPDGTLDDSIVQAAGDLLLPDAQEYQEIYRAMCATRVFYDHCERIETKRGQVRLHIGPRGQEAAEVASTLALDAHDWIFYYARSYGVALARGIAFRSLIDSFYYYGEPPESCVDDFLHHRILLPYTWVGMHIPHAVGAAWAEKMRNTNTIAVAYFGDGATAEGDFHGAMEWASVFEVPVVFVCENNQYAISTPSRVQNPAPTFAAKAAAYNMASDYVDGNDALAMYATMKRASYRARFEHKPTLIEAVTYRDGPHTSAVGEICPVLDEEKKRARENDPLRRFRLLRSSEVGSALFASTWTEEQDTMLSLTIAEEIHTVTDEAYQDYLRIYEQCRTEMCVPFLPPVRVTRTHTQSRVQERAFVPKTIPDADCRDGANVALYDALTNDADIVCVGQDIGLAGGVMRTTALAKSFVQQYIPDMQDRVIHGFLPLKHLFPERIIDAPLNEAAIAGVCLGMSIAGMRPIFEMQFSGFVRSALHHIQEYGRLPQRHRNMIQLHGICRLPFGHGDRIEYHNECEIGEFARMHGIIVACPSTPQDFYDMFLAATRSNQFVAFFEHLDLYRQISLRQNITRRAPVRSIEDFGIRIAREGTDLTIASYGRMLHESLGAANDLAESGISVEVLDLRIIAPLDKEALLNSVRKTGRFLVVQEECVHGFGAYLVSIIADEALEYIRAPRIPVLSTPCRFAPPPRFWEFHVPLRSRIAERVKELIQGE